MALGRGSSSLLLGTIATETAVSGSAQAPISPTEIAPPAPWGGRLTRPLCGAIRGADVGLQENGLEDGLERPGRIYDMRLRLPARFAEVEPRAEVNLSLKTRDMGQARARLAIGKRVVLLLMV